MILPILIMILFSIFTFGNAYNNYLAITHAAREGARLAALGSFNEETVRDRAFPANPDSITVTYPNGNVRGEPVEVTVTDQFHLDIPFFGVRDFPLSARVVMRIEV